MPAPAPDAFGLWLLPGLFLLHDLEETLWLPRWLHRHRELLTAHFPRLAARVLPHATRIGRGTFALMADEELILLTAVTSCTCRSGHYAAWQALFLAFTLHLCLHVGQALVLRRLFPAVVTAVGFLPMCGWIQHRTAAPYSGVQLAACTAAGVAALNLRLLHRIAGRRYTRRRS